MRAGWRDSAPAALNAFRISCPALTKRTDRSGLTTGEDWWPACAAAAEAGDPVLFFEQHFETAVIGSGEAILTGYYEPEILGARTHGPGYAVPGYKRPDDLFDVVLGQFSDALKVKRIRGQIGRAHVGTPVTNVKIECRIL